VPEPSRIQLPDGYGEFEPFTLENVPRWDDFEPMLEQSRNYWLAISGTVTPIVAPVWGIWVDGVFVFSTDPVSRKAKALAKQPGCVIHLESGDDVLIVHGIAERLAPGDALPYLAPYERKYGVAIDLERPDHAAFRVTPLFALSWLEREFGVTATRWDF
jgi:hypothetical protein